MTSKEAVAYYVTILEILDICDIRPKVADISSHL